MTKSILRRKDNYIFFLSKCNIIVLIKLFLEYGNKNLPIIVLKIQQALESMSNCSCYAFFLPQMNKNIAKSTHTFL